MSEYTEYIAGPNEPERTVVASLLAQVRALVPDAAEGKSYGMPALKYRGKALISFIATKKGYSVFPFSADVVALVVPQLDGFESTKGGIRFTDQKPIPADVVERMVLARTSQIDQALTR
jgi:uncharacterized protein YdhG (YjbR/CyaY superfamily)